MPEPAVSCRSLSKRYRTATGSIEALHRVDADFEQGALTAVVGASGSGKSTLLRLLAGLDRPTAGELLSDGRNLAAAAPADLRRHRRHGVTYVHQKAADNFVPHLTLCEHAREAPPLAGTLLEDVGLAHRLTSKPIELSGGEQARAAFALALARGTPLVVIDEPTAELDRESAKPLLAAIRRYAQTGRTIVVATHDPDVTAIADRVLRLDRGQVAPGVEPQGSNARPARAAADRDIAIEADALGKSFGDGSRTVTVVRDASLWLARGELAVLLGRSGSGKSTLLTLLAGWQRPDRGRVLWNRQEVDPGALRWGELAYVPQRFGLVAELTVRENVGLPVRLARRPEDHDARIDELLESLGLVELATRLPRETSIGQQQRTALARALVLEPAVLLADEPSSHQDAAWHDAVWELLAHAAERGTAILAATHEEKATRYATQAWEIAAGTVSRR